MNLQGVTKWYTSNIIIKSVILINYNSNYNNYKNDIYNDNYNNYKNNDIYNDNYNNYKNNDINNDNNSWFKHKYTVF